MAPQRNTSILPLAATIPAVLLASAWLYQRIHQKPSESATDDEPAAAQDTLLNREIGINPSEAASLDYRLLSKNTITIAYASTTGTCAAYATRLQSALQQLNNNYTVQLVKVAEVDWWDELVNNEDEESKVAGCSPVLLFVLPTWTDGTLPPESQVIIDSLDEILSDWRVAPEPLRGKESVRVGAFGMGSSAYDPETVGKPAKQVFSHLVKLGARPLVTAKSSTKTGDGKKSKSLMIGDAEVGDADIVYEKWLNGILSALEEGETKTVKGKKKYTKNKSQEKKGSDCACKESGEEVGAGCCSSKSDAKEESIGCCSNNNEKNDDNGSSTDSLSEDDDEDDGSDIVDLEDMGDIMNEQNLEMKSAEPKEMVTKKQAKALKKEGYKLIGTHSAVKLCRWTKHQLRGRGGCYKHTHYGITSYQCMEATPSLACANKCVFCWRHHKNPVGREWRWKTDDPKMIVEEAVNTHVSMIKETKGIPGIQLDRWEEAHRVRHCALSLVGEPIMYPRINELLGELHERKISTFLVTNGQHPQAINDLIPITQLYVSVDASTPESLEEIDRPLFRDAWDRLKTSLSCLKNKGQRTVARLTVVKGWNSDEIGGYARLIALGHCSLVEVKGVTFCGKSDASNLNMTNTPWHHEVVDFSKKLLEELNKIRQEGGDDPLPEYDLACEHKHSCSVLLARVDQFAIPDPEDPTKRKWRTWIDYDKFQELAAKHAADPTFKFGVEDYIADTPDWAVFGANEEGFDPTDNRHRRKKKHPKYTRFDADGVPTHDTYDEPLSEDEITKLKGMLERKKMEVGDCSTVTEFKSGEKRIEDASLMFRGLVVIR